jgi:hypothetical protein
MSAICSKATAQAVTLNPGQGTVKRRLPLIIPGRRYHLKLWIGVLDESAAYLPA